MGIELIQSSREFREITKEQEQESPEKAGVGVLEEIALKIKEIIELPKEDFDKKAIETLNRRNEEIPKNLIDKIPELVEGLNYDREFSGYFFKYTGIPYKKGLPKLITTIAFTEFLLENKEGLSYFY